MIIFRRGQKDVASALFAEARRVGATVAVLPLLDGSGGELSNRWTEAVRGESRGRLIAVILEDDISVVDDLVRHLCIPSDVNVMAVGVDQLSVVRDPEGVRRRCDDLLASVEGARQMRGVTVSGSCFHVSFADSSAWERHDGGLSPGRVATLPAGEISIQPLTMDGVFVADGAISMNRRIRRDVRLAAHPITLKLDSGFVHDVQCADPRLLVLLQRALLRPGANRVTRFGIGANTDVPAFSARNGAENRRRPGVCLGFADNERGLLVSLIASSAVLSIEHGDVDVCASLEIKVAG
ncbi:hypothetical protein ACIBHX_47535 [Nonomuraea sp. NPDC050536]|uniref:hypothetical protein n=1 Tax=Nonomuraea sp. NPDC050536 TaxID=3364366 RepID=UPI0037C9C6C8